MVSRDFQTLAGRRADRARKLAERYPASREALEFFAGVAALQKDLAASLPSETAGGAVAFDSLLPGRQPLIALVRATGPGQLQEQAQHYDEPTCRESLRAYFNRDDIQSPRSFFARVLLQPAMFLWDPQPLEPSPASAQGNSQHNCPRCAHAPQAGCLRPLGDGTALSLACSLCLHEWPFTRLRCPACGELENQKLNFYSTGGFAHLEVQVCESCKAYIHLVHLEKEGDAVPDVDELAALPLDVWARERGYRKIQPNLAGI